MYKGLLSKIKSQEGLIQNQAYSIISFIISFTISIVSVKLITSYIIPEEYGLYKYVLSVVSLCGITTFPGLNKTMGGYIIKGFHGTIKKATLLSVKTSFLGVAILVIFSLHSFFIKDNEVEAKLFFIASLIFIPYLIAPRYKIILTGLGLFKKKLVFETVFKIISLSSIFFLLVIFKKGVLAFGAAQLISQSFIMAIFFFFAIKKLENNKVDKKFVNHSLIISFIGLGSEMISPATNIYLNYSLGPAILGSYAIATSLTSAITGATKSIMSPVVIKIAKKNKINHNNTVFKVLPLAIFFGFLIYIIVFLFLHYLAPLIIGFKYRESIYFAKILTLIVILTPLYTVVKSNLLFEKNNKGYGVPTYAYQVFQFIGYVVFIPQYGVPAIGFTNFFSFLVSIIMHLWYIKNDKE